MSVKASTWAWQQDLSPARLIILLAMADHADDDGICWPSLGTLAAKTHIEVRQVQRHLRSLEDGHLVSTIPWLREQGDWASSTYLLEMGAITVAQATAITADRRKGRAGGGENATRGDVENATRVVAKTPPGGGENATRVVAKTPPLEPPIEPPIEPPKRTEAAAARADRSEFISELSSRMENGGLGILHGMPWEEARDFEAAFSVRWKRTPGREVASYAVGEAEAHGARKWAYVRKVLAGCMEAGGKPEREQRNGASKPGTGGSVPSGGAAPEPADDPFAKYGYGARKVLVQGSGGEGTKGPS